MTAPLPSLPPREEASLLFWVSALLFPLQRWWQICVRSGTPRKVSGAAIFSVWTTTQSSMLPSVATLLVSSIIAARWVLCGDGSLLWFLPLSLSSVPGLAFYRECLGWARGCLHTQETRREREKVPSTDLAFIVLTLLRIGQPVPHSALIAFKALPGLGLQVPVWTIKKCLGAVAWGKREEPSWAHLQNADQSGMYVSLTASPVPSIFLFQSSVALGFPWLSNTVAAAEWSWKGACVSKRWPGAFSKSSLA